MQRVAFYCPDRHILYDGRTPDLHGVGGGITTRVRMGRALAEAGCSVSMVVNCPTQETIDGVEYFPLESVDRLDADVVVLTTSGDRLDLAPVLSLSIRCGRKIIWCHGVNQPQGMTELDPDDFYVVSRFIGRIAREEWGVDERKILVTYNGYDERLQGNENQIWAAKDPFRLVYFSHPSKGLDAALGILQILRHRDTRFKMDVYGGRELWGQPAQHSASVPGVTFHGMLGQRALVTGLRRASYAIQLQTIRESGALAIPEAQIAGCVIIGSPVGCYPEQIRDGENGFLIEGDPLSHQVQLRAAELIERLVDDESMRRSVRLAARQAAISVQTVARAWVRLWQTHNDLSGLPMSAGVTRLA